MIEATVGRTDYHGKGWLQRNSSHVGTLMVIVFLFCVYVMLPLLDKPVPHIDAEAWLVIGGILGIQKWKSGQADIEANKRPTATAAAVVTATPAPTLTP